MATGVYFLVFAYILPLPLPPPPPFFLIWQHTMMFLLNEQGRVRQIHNHMNGKEKVSLMKDNILVIRHICIM